MPKHIALYLRVSSKQQDTKSQSPDLLKWSQLHADGQPTVMYRDSFTGTTMDRKGWNRLRASVDAGLVSKIVVWRLDRLGRTASGLTKLFDDLRARKVGLVSIKDGLDLDTAAGRLMANVLASVAQYETEVRAERVLAGQARARAEGQRWGGSLPGRRITVTDEQVRMIERMAQEGAAKAAIARATGLSRPTVYRILAQQGLVDA